jgi:hypothetical protein
MPEARNFIFYRGQNTSPWRSGSQLIFKCQQKGKTFQSKQTSKIGKCFRRQQIGKIFNFQHLYVTYRSETGEHVKRQQLERRRNQKPVWNWHANLKPQETKKFVSVLEKGLIEKAFCVRNSRNLSTERNCTARTQKSRIFEMKFFLSSNGFDAYLGAIGFDGVDAGNDETFFCVGQRVWHRAIRS